MRISSNNIIKLQPNEIFVFGSNLAGMHGGGAARLAYQKFGAVWGQGVGLQGQSYAIPTMQGGGGNNPALCGRVYRVCKATSTTEILTEIGCGIAGFSPSEIAPLFEQAREVKNIYLPERFWMVLK